MFRIDESYTRAEINKRLGGGQPQSYFISLGGPIVAGCFRPELNPRAPLEIYPGFGRNIEAQAAKVVEQESPFHAFIKRGNKDFRYRGLYRAVSLSNDPALVKAAESVAQGRKEAISCIVKCVRVD